MATTTLPSARLSTESGWHSLAAQTPLPVEITDAADSRKPSSSSADDSSEFHTLESVAQQQKQQQEDEEPLLKLERQRINHPREETKAVKRVFNLFFGLQMMVNYDSGALPAALDVIQDSLQLTETELGVIGAMPYAGITLFAPVASWALTKFSQKHVLLLSLTLNVAACALLAGAQEFYSMAVARFLIGMTQATFVIYASVWVEEFAPLPSKTLWMGLLQVGVPVGVMIGYSVAGMLTNNGVSWRWALSIQCFLLTLLTFLLSLCDYQVVDNPWTSPRMRPWRDELAMQGAGSRAKTTLAQSFTANPGVKKEKKENGGWEQCKALLRNGLYVKTVSALSALYFVVTGVQYWATKYLVAAFLPRDDVTSAPIMSEQKFKNTVLVSFAICALTGPAVGVILGSLWVDKIGGYEGVRNRLRSSKLLLCFAVVAASCGIGASSLRGGDDLGPFFGEVTFLWLLLAFGGGIVPALTGMMLSVVPLDARSGASALGQAACNVMGFALGTAIPGAAMSASREQDEIKKLRLGFTLILLWSFFGVAFLGWMILQQLWQLRQAAKRLRLARETLALPDAKGLEKPDPQMVLREARNWELEGTQDYRAVAAIEAERLLLNEPVRGNTVGTGGDKLDVDREQRATTPTRTGTLSHASSQRTSSSLPIDNSQVQIDFR